MIFVGMFILIFGLFVAVAGWYNDVDYKTIGTGSLGMLSGACLLISEDVFFIVLGAIGAVTFVVITVLISKKGHELNKSKKKKLTEAIGGTSLDRFFVECVLAEVDDFSKPKNVMKAQFLADKYKLDYTNGIDKLYKKGLDAHNAVGQRFILNRLEELRVQEELDFEKLNKYSDLTGKEKRIIMLMDRADELRKEAKRKENSANMIMKSGLQKERNWATWGGMANGIAGIGAGIATAADIHQKNMQIRESNDKHRRAVMPAYLSVSNSATDKRKCADNIMKEIEDFKLKLISDVNADILMKEINFDKTEVVVSQTGAARVHTVASLNPNFKIFDDVEAVVDGTIIAKIYDDDNKMCGTAKMVIPMYGLRRNVKLEGICIGCCESGKKYTVKFVAKNIWAMEV